MTSSPGQRCLQPLQFDTLENSPIPLDGTTGETSYSDYVDADTPSVVLDGTTGEISYSDYSDADTPTVVLDGTTGETSYSDYVVVDTPSVPLNGTPGESVFSAAPLSAPSIDPSIFDDNTICVKMNCSAIGTVLVDGFPCDPSAQPLTPFLMQVTL
jgi:hypothetical protein